MGYLPRILIILALIAGFVNCSLTEKVGSSDSSGSGVNKKDINAQVKAHAKRVMEAFEKGDYSTAKQELNQAKMLLSQLDLKSDAEKIDYLDRAFLPARHSGVTYAIIEEELSEIDKANSQPPKMELASYNAPGPPAALDSSVAKNNPALTEDTLSEPLSPDVSAGVNELTSLDEDDAFVADVPTINSDFSGRSYFDSKLHNFIQQEIREVAIHMGEPKDFKLPSDFVKEIEHYIRRFQTEEKYREFFERSLRRSRKYIPALKHYFQQKGFPEEIIYLAFIESGFNPVARSRSNAVGMFQFIKSTGQSYGLKINNWTDERYSPTKSALACREYMHDLLLELGSFTLALSSYNSGAGKTRQALRQLDDFKDRSFWSLREKTTVLKHETREYVPQIFATIVMAQEGHPQKFGFQDVPFPDPSSYRTVLIPSQMSLKSLADAGNISVTDLRELNPDLEANASATPSRVLDYPLFVPRESERRISSYLASYFKGSNKPVAKSTSSSKKSGASSSSTGRGSGYVYNSRDSRDGSDGGRSGSNGSYGSGNSASVSSPKGSKSYIEYTVQPGNNLSQIAGWFGTSVNQLEAWNTHLSSRGLQVGDVIYIKETEHYWSQKSHRINKGETISTIARQYGVSMDDLRAWNGIQGDNIIAGRTLTVFVKQGGSNTSGTAGVSRSTAPVEFTGYSPDAGSENVLVQQTISRGEAFMYRVASGNTLSDIAGLFGVSVNQIMSWNGLGSSGIQVGQRLRIVSSRDMKFYKYRVREGESLGEIANRFGAGLQTLRIVNGVHGDDVRVGEVLSIFSI